MKSIKLLLIGFLLTLLYITTTPVDAATQQVIYFKETTCLNCAELQGYLDGPNGDYTEDLDYIKKMTDAGITVVIYDIMANPVVDEYSYTNEDGEYIEVTALDVFAAFNDAYGRSLGTVPVVFVGDAYFEDTNNIQAAFDNGTITTLSSDELRDISVQEGQAYEQLTGFFGFLLVLGAGLLDGFNPCAIALLLLFISLLGFTEDKRVLILVSVVYIFALFVSYFLIGTFFLHVLERFTTQISVIGTIVNYFILFLCLFLFLFNLYDFIQARNENYGNIKNQLPKWLQKYNKKIVKIFTNAMNAENKKSLIAVLLITFVLGITLSVTELVCTGQIYFGILYGIHTVNPIQASLLLLAYNLMFVSPLIVIAVVAVRMKSIVSISNWIREHMSLIKFLNALLFFVIFLFFLYRVIV